MRSNWLGRACAVSIVLTMGVAACGGDDEEPPDAGGAATEDAATSGDSSGGDEGTTDESAGSDGSETAEASGEPIVIGYVNTEQGSSSTFPDMRSGAEAAVELANENGGVGGRPVQLEVCETDGSPEASQACANEIVGNDDIVAVATGIDYGGPAAIPIITGAGIPYVTTLPTTSEDYTTPGAFTFFGGSAGQYAGQVRYITETLEASSVGVLVINVPQGTSAAESLVKAPLEQLGVSVDMVTADPNTADFTPMLTALQQNEPDVITVLFTGPPCGQIMAARGSLGIETTTLFPSGCIDQAYLDAGGVGAEGVRFSVETLPTSLHADDADVATYLDAMDRFAGIAADELTNYHQVGYVNLIDLVEVLRSVDGGVTPATVLDAISSSVDEPSPMAGSYTCDGSVLPPFTAICNAAVRIVEYDGAEFAELTSDWLVPG